METKRCPFCAEEIAAEAIKCKHCGSFLDGRADTVPPVYDYPPVILTIPILISACWNAMTALAWAFFIPCIGLMIAMPYVALAVFEFRTFQRSESMQPRDLHARCGVLGVLQIVLGLTNLAPVACGVLLLVYRDRLLAYRESLHD